MPTSVGPTICAMRIVAVMLIMLMVLNRCLFFVFSRLTLVSSRKVPTAWDTSWTRCVGSTETNSDPPHPPCRRHPHPLTCGDRATIRHANGTAPWRTTTRLPSTAHARRPTSSCTADVTTTKQHLIFLLGTSDHVTLGHNRSAWPWGGHHRHQFGRPGCTSRERCDVAHKESLAMDLAPDFYQSCQLVYLNKLKPVYQFMLGQLIQLYAFFSSSLSAISK